MKKVIFLLCALQALTACPSFGMGKTVPTLTLNPYITALQNEFAAAGKPAILDHGIVREIAHGINMGERYDCRVYYALSQKNVSSPAVDSTWYDFSTYGQLFVDNSAALQTGKIKTFAVNSTLGNELFGESDDRMYFEAIRVNKTGDLIIEGSTPPQVWIKSMLSFLGLGNSMPDMSSNIDGLALNSEVTDSGNLVVSYIYCPSDHITPAPSPSPSPSSTPFSRY